VWVAWRLGRRPRGGLALSSRRAATLLLEADVRVAALNASDFRPRAIPMPLYEELKALERSNLEDDA
jgi:acyl-CoA thioester hydrolase